MQMRKGFILLQISQISDPFFRRLVDFWILICSDGFIWPVRKAITYHLRLEKMPKYFPPSQFVKFNFKKISKAVYSHAYFAQSQDCSFWKNLWDYIKSGRVLRCLKQAWKHARPGWGCGDANASRTFRHIVALWALFVAIQNITENFFNLLTGFLTFCIPRLQSPGRASLEEFHKES